MRSFMLENAFFNALLDTYKALWYIYAIEWWLFYKSTAEVMHIEWAQQAYRREGRYIYTDTRERFGGSEERRAPGKGACGFTRRWA